MTMVIFKKGRGWILFKEMRTMRNGQNGCENIVHMGSHESWLVSERVRGRAGVIFKI